MIQYTRNIRPALFVLRLFALIGGAGMLIFVFLGEYSIVGIIIIFLALFALIKVTKVTLKQGTIELKRYHFFGWAENSVTIDANSELKGELFLNEDLDNADTDSILDVLMFAIPFLYKKYSLWVRDNQERVRLIVKLTHDEYSILQSAIKLDKALPLT
jgi:hypothetical protein